MTQAHLTLILLGLEPSDENMNTPLNKLLKKVRQHDRRNISI